jgi:DNA polymerase-3 subunit alpha
MYLIFDTETTGLPLDHTAPLSDFDNWPRCVQLAWQLHDHTGQLLSDGNFIIRPDGFTIPFISEKIHGISTERAEKEGIPIEEVMEHFERDIERAHFLIGHNLQFDLNIMGSEYLRYQRPSPFEVKQVIDTKDDGTAFCAIPGGVGRFKWPTLAELHQKLFDVGFESAHDAAADVDATARAFLEMVRLNVIQITLPSGTHLSTGTKTSTGTNLPTADNPATGLDLSSQPASQWIDSNHYMDAVHDLRSRGVEAEDRSTLQKANLPTPRKGGQAVSGTGTSTGVNTNAGTDSNPAATPIADTPFVHLHHHSKYSVLQAAADTKETVKKAKADGMPAVALTDLGNMYGVFHFVQAAHAEGIKPIIGCELYFVEDRHQKSFTRDHKDRRYQQPFLVKNRKGFENLSVLSSLGFTEGYYYKFPRIDRELVQTYREGLIALTGGLQGEVPFLILNKGEEFAEKALVWWHQQFGDDLYIELMRHGLEEEERVNQVLLRFAEKYGIKTVATNNAFYLDKKDARAHDALLCIDNGEIMSTPIGRGRGYRFGFPNDEFYFKTQEEMKALFADQPDAIRNTADIAEKVEAIDLRRDVILPNFELPEGFDDESAYLRHLTIEGARERYGEISDVVQERIDLELSIIASMGFPGYFLIVQDFIAAARDMGVFVGPGRGSAAGSVVAYCTGITNIDPLRYDLLFERFLNPERVSMPDIDIDFDDDGRQKVIDYVTKKYGKEQVAHIITFGTMAARSSVRDVARVLDLPLVDADRLAKMIPETIGISLQDAIRDVRDLREIRKQEDQLEGQTLAMAETLEGSVRNTGIHAAGIIIAPDRLTKYIPIATAKDADLYVTQFDGKVIEDAGMLKMDFLGLKTLSILKTAMASVQRNHQKEYNLDTIPLDDEKTFAMYSDALTIGTFQFESEGMRKHLKDLKPSSVNDLIAMNALYRPGPMQFIPDYIRRKHGKENVEYPHDDLREILEPTFGIMIYQEQIMKVAQTMGGYTLGEADVLRRIMGKKKPELLPPEEEKFMKQALAKGYDKAVAKDVFDKMAMFAGYGFNKSHSAAYSVVAYHTMYFKANYTAEYMAAVLSHNKSDIKKTAFFIEECQRLGIEVQPPDINTAESEFVAVDGHIQYGMSAIKGVGESAIHSLVDERTSNGPFPSIFDFVARVDSKICNRRMVESLIQAGAFDTLHDNRAQLLASMDEIMAYGSQKQEEKRQQQVNLFDAFAATPNNGATGGAGSNANGFSNTPTLRNVDKWTAIERLNKERELIGFYLSGHPLDRYKEDINLFSTTTLDSDRLGKLSDRSAVSVVGIITGVRQTADRKGRPMAFVQFEDLRGSAEMLCFSETYDRHQGLIALDTVVMVQGSLDTRRGEPKIIANSLERVENLREKFQNKLRMQILLHTEQLTRSDLEQMAKLFQAHKGQTTVSFRVKSAAGPKPLNMTMRKFVVDPSNELLKGLRDIVGKSSVSLMNLSG